MRECSVEILAARSWSSQKPGSPISRSSSASRAASASGSKVITDPGELGPDLLELLRQGYGRLGHGRPSLAPAADARTPDAALDVPKPLEGRRGRLAPAAAKPDGSR